MTRVHLPSLTENTWKIFIAAVIRTWYGKTMAHNMATKHARVKTLNRQVASKLGACGASNGRALLTFPVSCRNPKANLFDEVLDPIVVEGEGGAFGVLMPCAP